jgi:uncharacterized repeat protein (TIGR02543 family)
MSDERDEQKTEATETEPGALIATRIGRRRLALALGAAGVALGLPTLWTSPNVVVGVLPAHAMTSGTTKPTGATIKVAVVGNGAVNLTGTPTSGGGFPCTGSCTATFDPKGGAISFQAVPGTGYVFQGWSSDNSAVNLGTNPAATNLQLDVSGAGGLTVTITATFVKNNQVDGGDAGDGGNDGGSNCIEGGAPPTVSNGPLHAQPGMSFEPFGTNLGGTGAKIKINGVTATVNFGDEGSIDVTVPETLAPGTYTITIDNGRGCGVYSDMFIVDAPADSGTG